jgi:hypothetical protein
VVEKPEKFAASLPPRWRIAEKNRRLAGKAFLSPLRKLCGARGCEQRIRLATGTILLPPILPV